MAILRDSSAFMLYPYSALDIKKLLRSAILGGAEENFLVDDLDMQKENNEMAFDAIKTKSKS